MLKIQITEEELKGKNEKEVFSLVQEKLQVQKDLLVGEKTHPTEKQILKLLAKLRRPAHRDLIARELKLTPDRAELVIQRLVGEGLIESAPYTDFYRAKN
jgi:DNA-binding MarR family transcriptional regulator